MNLVDVTTRIAEHPGFKGTLHDRCVNGRLATAKGVDVETGAFVTLTTDADTGAFIRGFVGVKGVPAAREYKSEAGLRRRLAALAKGLSV